MKIVISGGGTGGHIYPALALMRYLEKTIEDVEFLYVGTQNGLESKIVPTAGYTFTSIQMQGLKRSLSLENIRTAYYLLTSISKAKKILKDFGPDLVIGTGGYVCAPVLWAASTLKIPTIIHEQNSIAGITNRLLAKKVDKIAICFQDVAKDFEQYAEKIVLTGNPRGQEVVEETKRADYMASLGLSTSQPTVVIFGGSRGAPKINQTFVEAVPLFEGKPYQVIAITGEIHYDKIYNMVTNSQKTLQEIHLFPYIKDMPQLFQNVDLVVCRSGATTLTELTALGIPSVLIPSPYVTANHQEANAQSLVDQGAARMILEADLSAERLVTTIDEILSDSAIQEKMSKAAKQMGIRDASVRLKNLIDELVHD